MAGFTLSNKNAVYNALGQARRIVCSPGCGSPRTLLGLLNEHSAGDPGKELYSGLLFDYPFLDAVRAGTLQYKTWHVTGAIRSLVRDGSVPFFPVRASQVTRFLDSIEPDTALVRVSPPNRHGFCSLGPSVGYPSHTVRSARTVIAEIDPDVPNTRGDSEVHISRIDVAIESEFPMAEYRRAPVDDVSRQIAENLVSLLPEDPTVQIGIGSIPEAFVDELVRLRIGSLRFAGMATDGMVDVFNAGLLDTSVLTPYAPITAVELMGTRTLMDFAHENAAIAAYGNEVGITASSLWHRDRFVTINSALGIDSNGQVASEAIGTNQISAVGGSIDFTESAIHSDGGLRVIAMNSQNVKDSASKIVRAFPSSTPVTIPRHSVDYVVTEYGAVKLGFASVRDRVELLASIAHPDHRDEILG